MSQYPNNAAGITALTGGVSAGPGSGSQAATVNSVGGKTSSDIAAAITLVDSATNVNTPSTLVERDGSGNFSAGTITASLNGNALTATSATTATTATTATNAPFITPAITINLTSGSPQALYTVPVGKSFQGIFMLVRGATAITGSPQMGAGSAAGGNVNLVNATPIQAGLTSATAMGPIPANATNTIMTTGTVINALVTATAAAGSITVQLVGVLF